MEFEIKPYESGGVIVTGSVVTFPGYQHLKEQAIAIADKLKTVTVTEDSLKDAKKGLAALRKSVKSLDDERLRVKNELLTSYNVFEKQVKEIKTIVDDGDRFVRQQVTALEEAERDKKHDALVEIWNKRAIQYPVTDVIPNLYEKWETPSHLNKTTPISNSERDMTVFLERVQGEWDTIETMKDAEQLQIAYCDSLSLATAINTVNAQKQLAQKIAETAEPKTDDIAVFIITGTANIKLTEMLLNENGIKYKRK